jgi:hypothetical protein
MKIASIKSLLIVVGFAAASNLSPEVVATPLSKFFDHPFDAVSVSQDAAGNMSTIHTVSDGKGHIRTETVSSSATLTSIFDHNSATLCTIREKDKVITKSQLPPNMLEPDALPKQNLQQLGQKVINGHPCVGESYHFDNTNFVTWRGQDVDNYTVKTIATTSGVQKVTELKSYNRNAPDPSIFLVPTKGYIVQGTAPAKYDAMSLRADPPDTRPIVSDVRRASPSVTPHATQTPPSGATPSSLEPVTKGGF